MIEHVTFRQSILNKHDDLRFTSVNVKQLRKIAEEIIFHDVSSHTL